MNYRSQKIAKLIGGISPGERVILTTGISLQGEGPVRSWVSVYTHGKGHTFEAYSLDMPAVTQQNARSAAIAEAAGLSKYIKDECSKKGASVMDANL